MAATTHKATVGQGRRLTLQSIPPLVVLVSLYHCLVKLFSRRVRFRRVHLGKVFVADDGARFTVFRDLRCRPDDGPDPTPAVFVVRLKFARLGSRANRLLSCIPIPLILGHAGFREKVWVEDLETGTWQGIYEWESADAARAYVRSFVLGRMFARAEPGSVTTEIIPETRLSVYLKERLETVESGYPMTRTEVE